MTPVLDGLLILALLSTIFATSTTRGSWGPEGPVGAWLLFVFPCLLVGALVAVFALRSMLDFIPGGRLAQAAAALGIVAALGLAFIGTLDRGDAAVARVSVAVPYLILLGCLLVIHRAQLPARAVLIPTILLGLAAAAGLGAIGFGIVSSMSSSMQQSAARSSQEDAREKAYEREEVEAYRKLPTDAPLAALLPSTWSRNAEVRDAARQRVRNWPGLDDELNRLLIAGNESVIHYVAFVYEKPPAKLAAGWASMLERQLKAWDSLQFDQYAGKWEPNLSGYFEGAQKIQKSGGDLRPHLQSWHELLSKSKGLGNLDAFVRTLLR